jgi:hypothetical protein
VAVADVLAWLSSQGFQANKLDVATFDGGLRGVKALEGVGCGEDILSVPWRLCVISRDSDDAPVGPEYMACPVDERIWAVMTREDRLAVRLMQERALGEASRSHRYIKVRPAWAGSGPLLVMM